MRLKADSGLANRAMREAIRKIKQTLGMSSKQLREVLNLPTGFVFDWLEAEKIDLDFKTSKEGQALIDLVTIYLRVSKMFGGDKEQIKQWLTYRHKDFKTSPLNYLKQSEQKRKEIRDYIEYWSRQC